MKRSDLIDKYIQKKASDEELKEIRNLMEKDVHFREAVIFHLELQKAVRKDEGQKLKEHLQRLEQKKNKKSFIPKIWKVAAVFVIGLGLFWVFNMSPKYEKLYAENFAPYPNIVAPTVRDLNAPDNGIEEAFRYYDNGDYAKAAETFKAVYKEDKIGYANFYYGISLMANQETEKAVEALEDSDWDIPKRYQNQTNWYLALGYLKTKNKEKAIAYLEKVIRAHDAMAPQANKILMEIK
jgi:tetratricopeptide (TPR) repeat protein